MSRRSLPYGRDVGLVSYEGWRPAATPSRTRTREEHFDVMREPLRSRMANPDPARITRAVFGLLARHVSGGEIQQIVSGLPEELRGLWPSEVAAGA